MKSNITLNDKKQEYNDMTFDQVKLMVEYLNQGMSESEAKQKALEMITHD